MTTAIYVLATMDMLPQLLIVCHRVEIGCSGPTQNHPDGLIERHGRRLETTVCEAALYVGSEVSPLQLYAEAATARPGEAPGWRIQPAPVL